MNLKKGKKNINNNIQTIKNSTRPKYVIRAYTVSKSRPSFPNKRPIYNHRPLRNRPIYNHRPLRNRPIYNYRPLRNRAIKNRVIYYNSHNRQPLTQIITGSGIYMSNNIRRYAYFRPNLSMFSNR